MKSYHLQKKMGGIEGHHIQWNKPDTVLRVFSHMWKVEW